nr:LLM class flavin-dependent oxidoreductase [Candidatus Eremiobacteraeota bacterium]
SIATEKSLELSLFYFGSATQEGGESYDLLIDGAKFADQRGFSAVWTPERHFNDFGGLYPNPCVTAAALATVTERVRLRAGSTVILLHDAVRFAENWAMVDRLSGGRVDLALALGWNANDFVLAPDAFAERAALLPQRLAEVQALWRGEKRSLRDGAGNTVEVEIHPKPLQRSIPIWITAAGNPETFALAGRQGCNVLTYLEGQSVEQIATKIALYRRARAEAGHATPGHVSLMLHTFVGDDDASAVAAIRAPLRDYLRSSLFLRTSLLKSLGRDVGEGADVEPLLDRAVDRYVEIASLIGSPDRCAATLDRLQAVGVDEVACLIDFGLDRATTMQGLERLAQLKDRLAARLQPPVDDATLPMADAQRALWMLCRASADVSRAYVEVGALRSSGL